MLLKVRGAGIGLLWMMFAIVVSGCTIQDRDTKRQLSAASLIATPASHYSTQKARYLGEKYQEKLDRLIEMIKANPKTSKLQFANNLVSSGGMGFFTHSAVKFPDDRFLEVVLGTGENLEAGEYSEKLARLFSVYGRELLVILASDSEIYNDRELSGYGLNFTWRIPGSGMNTERAIVYLPKEKVRAFLRQDLGENTLLAEAVIFVMEPEGQANLLSFRAQRPAPDVRAPIQEQVLLPEPPKSKPDQNPVLAQKPDHNEVVNPANDGESSVGVKKKAISASESETGRNTRTPNGSLGTKEEIIPEGKSSPIVGGNIKAFGRGSAKESAAQSDQDPMPPTRVVETTRVAPTAVEFSQGQVEANAIESKLQLEKKEEKTPELISLVGVPEEKEQNEMRPDMAGSQRPAAMEEARPNEVIQPDLGIHALPELGSAEVPSSSATTSKPDSEVERLGEIASLTKINPKPAHPEKAVPAPITASKLQSGDAETVEQQAVPVHREHMEHLSEIKPFMKPMPKALEGYIIQVAFKDRSEARSWADTFEQRGYAVSMTEASAGESLRVRVGNFRVRDEAERQLKSIRDNGLIGIILNLPQAYRPEVRSSLP
jgi:hypothetical protein